jgi:hypothetical protein
MIKHCRKMKRSQGAHLSLMESKCDTVRRRRPEERWHWGGEREETTLVGLTRFLLGQKMKKIHVVDLAATNR